MTNRFCEDNTEGYSQEQLAELNARFEEAASGESDPDALDYIAERVQANFDSENA